LIFASSYGDIYYEIRGQENSTVIAFVHGMLMNQEMFAKQIDAFADQYKLLLWDMPQHGKSFSQKENFKFSIAAESFIELLDELRIEQVLLVGVSLGGWVTQYIASRYPGRVKAVAVEGCTPLHVDLSKVAFIFRIYIFMFKLLPWFIVQKIFLKMTDKMELDPELKENFKEIFKKLEKDTVLQLFGGVRDEISRGLEEEISQQILMTHGEDELSFFKKMGKAWQQENSRLSYREISDAGHGANTFNPSEYNRILLEFFNRVI